MTGNQSFSLTMAEKEDEVSWQEKYHDLEGSLQRFRKQAGKVKDSLGLEVGTSNKKMILLL